MKTKQLLVRMSVIGTCLFMVACSNNKQSNSSNIKPKTTQVSEENNMDTFIKNNKKLLENNRNNYYDFGQSTMYERAKAEAVKNNEQVFLSYQNLDSKLSKVKVTIGDYDNSTKRLAIHITNNYSEDLIGYNTSNKDDKLLPTKIAISGYSREVTGIKEDSILLELAIADDIRSGETVTLHVLMPYFASPTYKEVSGVHDYSNETFDSMYKHMGLNEGSKLVYENNDQNQIGNNAFRNYDNLFPTVSMSFKQYPKEAYVSDEELIEFFNLMK